MATNLPDSIAHYKIISAIGAGGMGEVYLAQDTKLERQVALKVLLDEVAGDEERVRRFVQEAKAASAQPPQHTDGYEIGDSLSRYKRPADQGRDASRPVAR
ncbi:MAG: hypothetical protein IPG58_20500 [Acidobacteria bacterium]|nr:hypothetical protein [Acidobacteriota bacterium]